MATSEVIAEQQALAGINADYKEKYGFFDPENYLYKAPKGLNQRIVEEISEYKSEPQWMRDFRLKALDHFLARPQPTWGSPMLAEVDYDNIHYFVRASERAERSWDDVPEDVKKTFDRLGIPEAERKFLSGVGAQYESEVVYHQIREDLEQQGVVFLDMDSGLREYEDIVREHWATVIPPNDNKLATKRAMAQEGATMEWVDCNLGSKLTMKYPSIYLLGPEAHGEILSIAFAGHGQHQDAGGKVIHGAPKTSSSVFAKSISKDGGRGSYRGLVKVTDGATEARSKVVCDALLL